MTATSTNPMHKLFLYRLTLILGQLLLLLLNLWGSFWAEAKLGVWVLCGAYLLLIVLLRWQHRQHHQKPGMLLVDLCLWGGYFYFLGGVSNPLIWCLLIPALLSALSQSVQFTWLITFLANGVYGLLWLLSNQMATAHKHHSDDAMLQQHLIGMWLGFMAVSVLLTWVSTQLMTRIHRKNQSILEKNNALLVLKQQRQADENIIKMATLATSLAHELGTPLTSIKLLVSELQLDLKDKQQVKDLKLLDSQVDRCKQVLEELTAVTAKERLDDSELMQVETFVTQLISAVNATDCVIKFDDHAAKEYSIEVDSLLHLACVNVLNNSLAADANHITISTSVEGGSLILFVTDDGKGVEYQNQGGLGIGLKLSERIFTAAGGYLNFKCDQTGAKTELSIPLQTD